MAVPFSVWTRICRGSTSTGTGICAVARCGRAAVSGLSSRRAWKSLPAAAGSHFRVEPMPLTG